MIAFCYVFFFVFVVFFFFCFSSIDFDCNFVLVLTNFVAFFLSLSRFSRLLNFNFHTHSHISCFSFRFVSPCAIRKVTHTIYFFVYRVLCCLIFTVCMAFFFFLLFLLSISFVFLSVSNEVENLFGLMMRCKQNDEIFNGMANL